MKQVARGESARRPLSAAIRLIMTIALFTLMAGNAVAGTETITIRVDGMT